MPVDRAGVAAAVFDLLVALGEDPRRPGLADTPRRVADAWAEFLDRDPGRLATAFGAESAQLDQLVVVRGMPLVSVCEHHLMPFRCELAVGYLARDRLLGLSKLGRVAAKHAHRLQLQERLVAGVAAEVAELAGSPDVAVVAAGEHSCMAARGVRLPHALVTSELRGLFREDPALRGEFLRLARA